MCTKFADSTFRYFQLVGAEIQYSEMALCEIQTDGQMQPTQYQVAKVKEATALLYWDQQSTLPSGMKRKF